jgi:hypothetical protein
MRSIEEQDLAALRLRLPKYVVAIAQEDRTVLLDVKQSHYYSLDDVGGRIWTLIGDGLVIPQILERLETEYAVPSAVLRTDVCALLNDMCQRALLEIA